jgi:hypothetical protein
MFYHNTKYRFTLAAGSPQSIAGAVILACAMAEGQMLRRDMRKQTFLQHRLFDPQLYLARLDGNTARKSVCNLATWPWFGDHSVPQYDSALHGSLKNWKDQHDDVLLRNWKGRPPETAEAIREAVICAVQKQVDLGCEGIILPAPMTNVYAAGYELETFWLDAGIEACKSLHIRLPIYATVAISDNVLRGVDAAENPLVHTITNQLASRDELAGGYFVIEQGSEDGYVCTSKDTLLAVLLMVDDLTRGAAKRAIVNYMGTFGPITVAAGATIYSTGYYLSQRRLKLSDFEDKDSRAYPRYLSLSLAGDIGISSDLADAYSTLGNRIFSQTPVAQPLHSAIQQGISTSRVPEWEYKQQNITAAGAHYNWSMLNVGNNFLAATAEEKRSLVHRWLREATRDAERLRLAGIDRSHSDISHQAVWLGAFEDWLRLAGLNARQ